MMGFLERINVKGKTLVVTGTSRQELVKSASNIPGTRVIHVDSINVYDILGYTHLVMTSDAVRKVEEVLG
jgi:large subunit ribosomal protein L4